MGTDYYPFLIIGFKISSKDLKKYINKNDDYDDDDNHLTKIFKKKLPQNTYIHHYIQKEEYHNYYFSLISRYNESIKIPNLTEVLARDFKEIDIFVEKYFPDSDHEIKIISGVYVSV